jgi:hypothetical protein
VAEGGARAGATRAETAGLSGPMIRAVTRLSLASLLAAAAFASGCAAAASSARRGGDSAIRLRAATWCSSVQFRARAAPELDTSPFHELVVAVNGQICHREALPRDAIAHGEVAALCTDAQFEPGPNRVDVALVPPGCGPRRPVARGRILCAAPEPD